MSLCSLDKEIFQLCFAHKVLHTNLSPFFLCLMPVAQQVADTMCSDNLKREERNNESIQASVITVVTG